MLKGKKLSILGDSISSYKGISDDGSANATLVYNPYFYREPLPLDKMYWHLLLTRLEMTLCVNNSWSGGNLSDQGNPDSGVNRAKHLARDDGSTPDLIILFMGINDLGRGVDVSVFAADYGQTLTTLKCSYPQAAVCCVNLPDRDPVLKSRTEQFNAAIDAAVKQAGENFFVADLFRSPLNNDCYYTNTLDGLHPDEDGMRMIADVIEGAVKRHDGSVSL